MLKKKVVNSVVRGPARLTSRLVGLMLVATVPAMMAGILVLYESAATHLVADAGEKLAHRAMVVAEKADDWMGDTARELRFLSEDSDVTGMDPARQRAALRRFLANYPETSYAHIVGRDGVDIARGDDLPPMDYHDRECFQRVMAGASMARATLAQSRSRGRPALNLAMPLKGAEGTIEGVIVAGRDLDTLSSAVDTVRFGTSGYSCLVDDKGRVLAHPDSAKTPMLQDMMALPPVKGVVEDHKARQYRYQDGEGVWWLAHTAPLANGWSAVSFQRESEALEQTTGFLALALAAMGGSAAVIALLTWLMARGVVKPITQITATADRIANGDWTQRIPQGRRQDEVGRLAHALNKMVFELTRMYEVVKEKAQALHERERAYRRLIDTAAEGIWTLDAQGKTTLVNAMMARMLGYSPEEMLGRHVSEFMDEEGKRVVEEHLARRRAGIEERFEFNFRRKDGTAIWTLASASPILDDEGRYTGSLGMVTDISRRKRTEQWQLGQNKVLELLATGRDLNEVLSALVATMEEQTPGVMGSVLLLDKQGERLYCKAAPHLPEEYTAAIDGLLAGPRVGSCGTAAYRGERVVVEEIETDPLWDPYKGLAEAHGLRACWSQPIWSKSRRVLGTFAMYFRQCCKPSAEEIGLLEAAAYLAGVVIEQRAMEQSLREGEERLRWFAETVPVGVIRWALDGRIIEANDCFLDLVGYRREELLAGKVRWSDMTPPEFYERDLAAIAELRATGRLLPYEKGFWRKDCTVVPVLLSAVMVDEARGEGISFVLDLTQRKRAEEERQQKERMSREEAVRAMEQVLGVVGHELRTPLAGLRAISELLLTDVNRQSAEGEVFLRQMNDETVRMSDMINNLLEAARLNSGRATWNWAEVDLERVCREALETVRPLVDQARVELTLGVMPPDARMRGDVDAIRRLVINLVSNARKHTSKGKIGVSVRLEECSGEWWTAIEVRDTGEGIPPEIISRLGEAFALNAGVVGANHIEGTGLGLAISKGIAAAHGGYLSIESRVGIGTRITARLRADLAEPAHGEARVEFVDQGP